MEATSKDDYECLHLLLTFGADFTNACSQNGMTALAFSYNINAQMH